MPKNIQLQDFKTSFKNKIRLAYFYPSESIQKVHFNVGHPVDNNAVAGQNSKNFNNRQ